MKTGNRKPDRGETLTRRQNQQVDRAVCCTHLTFAIAAVASAQAIESLEIFETTNPIIHQLIRLREKVRGRGRVGGNRKSQIANRRSKS